MQIGFLPLGALATSLVRRVIDGPPASAQAPPAPPPPRGIAEALAGFDLDWVTPRQFSALVERLQATGKLAGEDLESLQALRGALAAEGLSPDAPLNLRDWVAEQGQLWASRAAGGGDDEAAARAYQLARQGAALARLVAAEPAEAQQLDARV